MPYKDPNGQTKHYWANRERILIRRKELRLANIELYRQKDREYRVEHRNELKEKRKNRVRKNREQYSEKKREYRLKNKDKINKYKNEKAKEKRRIARGLDPNNPKYLGRNEMGQFTSDGQREKWKDPEYRARIVEGMSGENSPRYIGAKIKGTCIICGKTFEIYNGGSGSTNEYCSRSCKNKSEKVRNKIANSNTGKKATEATRKKLSRVHKGL